MSERTVRVLVADDNPLLRMGLTSLLAATDHIEVVAEAENGRQAVALAEEHRPDVAVLDVRMPEMDGVAAAARMPPGVRVLMLTYSDEPQVIATALDSGAVGYLVHGAHRPQELIDAVRSAAHGMTVLGPAATRVLLASGARPRDPVGDEHGLTDRETEIMELVADGLTNAAIAQHCFLAEKTVKNHINRIFAKLGVANRAEAVSLWLRTGPGVGPGLGPDQGPGAHDGHPGAP